MALKLATQNTGIGSLFDIFKSNPDEAFHTLMKTNPQFVRFVQLNKGKSAEQIARENGIDINTLMRLLK